MTAIPLHSKVQKAYQDHGVEWIFNNLLNWNTSPRQQTSITVDGTSFHIETSRELAGFKILTAASDFNPQTSELRAIDKKLSKLFPERLVIVTGSKLTNWVWPKKLSSGSASIEVWSHNKESLPTFLAQKLAGLAFPEKDIRAGLTIGQVSNKVKGQFDSTKITNAFFEDFSKQHQALTDAITGLPNLATRQSYASTILNRLMFIYFLQKKEFLNGDPNYLNSCFKTIQVLRKKEPFYNFYRDLLRKLFQRLGEPSIPEANPAIAELLASIPYVNGGIFQEQPVERDSEIEIPDAAFAEIFTFFDKYVWHLDTRSTGVENEINPEIIGYIFEQYINLTSAKGKKENGAYYTKHDVTSYMTEYTVVSKYLDKVVEFGHNPFKLVQEDPIRYLKSDAISGYDLTTNAWLPLPEPLAQFDLDDVKSWSESNYPDQDLSLQLPHEDWILTLNRRRKTDALLELLSNGEVKAVNDLATYNLDAVLLLKDFHDTIERLGDLQELWDSCSSISVIDPTCGSGAFLFAALEHFEEIYGSLLTARALEKRESEVDEPQYVKLSKAHKSVRYFIRKHCAIRNLYGTDLMGGAIETAKLRLFLSLASCLESIDELEPLPDLDLNLKQGNLVFGIYDILDLERIEEQSVLASGLDTKSLDIEIAQMAASYKNFANQSSNSIALSFESKEAFLKQALPLKQRVNDFYAKSVKQDDSKIADWISARTPFHWFIEFPQIAEKGGFDVVVGNPPYIYTKKSASNPFSSAEMQELKVYRTSACPDFYAICYERSFQLLGKDGRHSFIVPNSLAFSDDFLKLRQIISELDKSEWWSTYGKDPQGLFTPVAVRNTILILGPGTDRWQTQHKIVTKESRTSLFSQIEYSPIYEKGAEIFERAGELWPITKLISESIRPEARTLDSSSIYVKGVASNWFPVLLGEPKVLTFDKNIHVTKDYGPIKIQLREHENLEVAIAVLATKTAYLWWASVGDDYHVKREHAEALMPLVSLASGDPLLVDLARKVVDAGLDNCFANKRHGALAPNVKWSKTTLVTDEFEIELLRKLGLEQHWPALNLWHRVTARMDSEIAAAIPLSKEEVSSILGWH
jgi:hypothetical protein